MNDYRGFTLALVKKFALQLLTAVSFLHANGLIHTDLKLENILLVDGSYTYSSNDNSYRIPILTDIRLIDFGGATFSKDHHASIIATRQYRAPEVVLGW